MTAEESYFPNDPLRQLIELAISSGRSRQSAQTGLIHYCYHTHDEGINDTIPVLENCLFALALFRTRIGENIVEAKTMLERLLPFQNFISPHNRGNFPVYLHEYPRCTHSFLGADLLPVFYWILKLFSPVLGTDLKQKLEMATKELLSYTLNRLKEKEAPFHIAIKIAASCKVLGEYFQQQEWIVQGEKNLFSLKIESESENFGSWGSPAYLADTLVALQMLYPIFPKEKKNALEENTSKKSIPNNNLSNDIFSEMIVFKDSFYRYLSQTWHRLTGGYIGPSIREMQRGEEPEATLYDLFLGHFTGKYSYRVFTNHSFQLQGALIQSFETQLPQVEESFQIEGKIAELTWVVKQQKKYAYSAIQHRPMENVQLERYFHPFRLIWGDLNRVHTFVCQSSSTTWIDFETHPDRADLFFSLHDVLYTEDREKNQEMSFYFDAHESVKITVLGKTATTFQLGEKIEIRSDELKIGLAFHLEQGDGRFFGHIIKGNRPSQINLKGEHRLSAFDWQIFLRTIRRYTPCKIKVEITIEHL